MSEIRKTAMPHEVAALEELLLDAGDATTAEQLAQIDTQFRDLVRFTESRKKSDANMTRTVEPNRRV